MIPEDMRAELRAWNNGTGVSLGTWVACEGDMTLAAGYSTVFWPTLVLVGDSIVRSGVTPEVIGSWEKSCGGDKRAVEAVRNHLHVADLHAHGDPETTVDRVRFLLPPLKEIYEAKLKWQFPDRPCEVLALCPEDENDVMDYQITFWQRKHG